MVDEAYFPFSRKIFLPMLKKYDNLVVMRTVSKLGLAAIRVGFLMGSRTLIGELNKVRLPYNINVFPKLWQPSVRIMRRNLKISRTG